MVDTTQFFTSDSPYIKAADNEGFAQACTVEAAGSDEYNGEAFIWIKLDGLPKPMRLNKTNGRGMVGPFGSDTDGWVGKQVFISTRPVTLGDGRNTVGWIVTPIKQDTAEGKPFNDDIPM